MGVCSKNMKGEEKKGVHAKNIKGGWFAWQEWGSLTRALIRDGNAIASDLRNLVTEPT